MQNRIRLLIVILTLSVNLNTDGQESALLYTLSDIPQASFFNPAVQNREEKFFISVPLISGISAGWSSNVPLNALFYSGFDYSFERLYNRMDATGIIHATTGTTLLFASVRFNNLTLSISAADRFISEGRFDREIIGFIRDGTLRYFNEPPKNLGNFTFSSTQYREIAPALSINVNDKLDIGIRPKLLFGRFNFKTKDFNLSLETKKNDQETNGDQETNNNKQMLMLNTDGVFKFSGPYAQMPYFITTATTFQPNIYPGDYFFQFRNLGVAVDLGIIYRINSSTEISASIVDIGSIGFRHNGYDINFKRPIKFDDLNLYQSVAPASNNYREPKAALIDLIDSLSYINDITDARERTFSYLPFKVNLGGNKKLSKELTAGFINQFTYLDLRSQNIFTTYLTTAVNQSFELSGSLSILNVNRIFPGFGVDYQTKWLQLFFTTNNVLGVFLPKNTKNVNLYFGINFMFDIKKN